MRRSRALFAAIVLGFVLACAGGAEPGDAPTPSVAEPAEPAAAEARTLDALFAGIENGCAGNDRLTGLLASIAEPDGEGGWRPAAKVDAPAPVRDAFGAPGVSGGDADHVRLSVPVTDATWLGLPVVRIDRWLGKENGINGFAIALVGEPAAVEATVRAKLTITDSCAGDPECPIEPFMLTFAPNGAFTTAVCDTSM